MVGPVHANGAEPATRSGEPAVLRAIRDGDGRQTSALACWPISFRIPHCTSGRTPRTCASQRCTAPAVACRSSHLRFDRPHLRNRAHTASCRRENWAAQHGHSRYRRGHRPFTCRSGRPGWATFSLGDTHAAQGDGEVWNGHREPRRRWWPGST